MCIRDSIGSHTRKIIKCFNKYGVVIAIKKCETVFDKIRNKNIENNPRITESGIYNLKCKEWNKVYPVSYTHLDVYKRQKCGCGWIPVWSKGIFVSFVCFIFTYLLNVLCTWTKRRDRLITRVHVHMRYTKKGSSNGSQP